MAVPWRVVFAGAGEVWFADMVVVYGPGSAWLDVDVSASFSGRCWSTSMIISAVGPDDVAIQFVDIVRETIA